MQVRESISTESKTVVSLEDDIPSHAMKSCRIKLDVGGASYSTSLTTLTMLEPSSALSRMFTPPFDITPEGKRILPFFLNRFGEQNKMVFKSFVCIIEDGTYFIDRDGLLFRHILNWLRDGSLSATLPAHLIPDLVKECKFFGLNKMEAALLSSRPSPEVASSLEGVLSKPGGMAAAAVMLSIVSLALAHPRQ